MAHEPLVDAAFSRELLELIEANRSRALWYLAKDFVPTTPEDAKRVLEAIALRGDRATWVRARKLILRLKQAHLWHLPDFKGIYARFWPKRDSRDRLPTSRVVPLSMK